MWMQLTGKLRRWNQQSFETMKTSRLASLVLAALLQIAPFAARTVESLPVLANSPAAIVLKWVVGALALVGTYHTVSAATAVLASSKTIQGTTGTRLSYQIKINDGQNRTPGSWVVSGQVFGGSGSTTLGLPPGLSLALNTGIISGTPTQGGTSSVTITAYEHANRGGGKLTFTLSFIITSTLSPPAIVAQPAGGEIVEGNSFTFTVVASGTTPLAYQWQLGGNAIPSATTATLTLNPVRIEDSGTYTVTVSNSDGSSTSAAAILTVKTAVIAPTITAQPVNITVHAGEKITLGVSEQGSGPFSHQWKHNGVTIAGSTNASFSVAAASSADAGDYVAVVSGPGGNAVSSIATVTIVPLSLAIRGFNSGGATLVLQTIPGRSYAIQASETLGADSWQTVGLETATADTLTVQASGAPSPQRFWRYGLTQ
jgi:hypothetical protein